MKVYKLALTFLMIVLFCACNLQSNKKAAPKLSELEKYELAYKQASNSAMTIDTIFMGLRFGMSPKEVGNYLREMQDNVKLKTDGFGRYQYILSVYNKMTLTASLNADFYNDKLYKFTLNFDGCYIGNTMIDTDSQTMSDRAKSLFVTKYKIDKDNFIGYYYSLEGLGMFSCFINKNLLVEFNPLGSMSYINVPIEVQKVAEKEKQTQQKRNESISDL